MLDAPLTPIDGIAPPASSASAPLSSAATAVSPRTVRVSLSALAGTAVLYILPALALLAMFPRVDGRLSALKQAATFGYAGMGIVIVLVSIVISLHIASKKDRHPRIKLVAMARLAAWALPLLITSVVVPLRINVPPTLSIEILSPASLADLVAPVDVSFGLQTALGYYQSLGLSPLRFEWDFNGDAQIDQESFDPQATYIYGKSGIFLVTCRITMSSGETRTLTRRLVIPRSGVGVQPSDPVVDEPAAFSVEHLFSNASDKDPKLVKAKWDFDGDGVIDLETDGPTASYTFHRLGSATVSVLLMLSNQTQQTLTRALRVVSPPLQPFPVTMDVEPATLLGAPPFGVVFAIKTDEPLSNVLWDFGNRKSAEGVRAVQVYTDPGTYTVTASIRSQTGALAKLTKIVRVTKPLQIPDLTFEGTPPVRSFTVEGHVPLAIDLTPVTSQPLVSFSWDIPSSLAVQALGKQLQGVFRDPGSYAVDLLGIDSEQKVFRRRVRITALPPASLVTFSMAPETPTAPADVRFDASDVFVPNEEITGFEWDFGDSASQGSKFSGARVEHRYERPGTYTITLTVRVTSGKSYQSKKTILVRAPVLDACFLPSRRSGTAPLAITFDPSCSTGDFVTWRWDFGDGSQSDERVPTHVFEVAGDFNVTLTAQTAAGQRSIKAVSLSVSPP